MSEFKYACPVCGQHIKCDSSQGGSVMECPTCFQKIIVPQAPAPDAEIHPDRHQVREKKIPSARGRRCRPVQGGRWEGRFRSGVFVLALGLLAGAGMYFFGGNIVRSMTGGDWQACDIGEVGAPGSFSRANGVFTVTGSGADIWRRADGFQYVYQTLEGDGSLTAHVLNLKNTDVWAKAGVMIRESTNANSMCALSAMRPDGQAQFIWRDATGQEAASSRLAGGPGHPKWVKIVRSGNTFTAYCKVNAADEWQQIGSPQTIKMASKIQAGLVVCAHHARVLSQAQFDQVTLETGARAGGW